MDWLHEHLAWTLVGPLIAGGAFLWALSRRRLLIQRIGDRDLVKRLVAHVSPGRRRWKALLTITAIALIAIALIGPRFGTAVREVTREGVDLIVALDVSLSMEAEDVAPNRLSKAKNELKKLMDNLRGDRVGLVLFAGDAFLQCPLTTDYAAVKLFLDVAEPSLIPTAGTDFGAALKTAIDAFEAQTPEGGEARTRALLFVSDGENHVADLKEIVDLAERHTIVLYAAGVGETEGVPIRTNRSRRSPQYKKDRLGRVVTTRLEEDALKSLAQKGDYFRVAKTSSSLPRIIKSLEKLERAEFAEQEFEDYEERFQWPLLLAIVLLLVEPCIGDRHRRSSTRYEGV